MGTQGITAQDTALLERMAQQERDNQAWKPSNKHEKPMDIFTKKMGQAEALAITLYGEGFDTFSNTHDRIQEGVLWLLSDLITDAREAYEDAGRAARGEA